MGISRISSNAYVVLVQLIELHITLIPDITMGCCVVFLIASYENFSSYTLRVLPPPTFIMPPALDSAPLSECWKRQSVDVQTCPWSMTRTRSHCSTVCMECAMTMSVQSQNVCRIVSCIRAAVSESSDDIASSNTTIYTTPTKHHITLQLFCRAHLLTQHPLNPPHQWQVSELKQNRNNRSYKALFHQLSNVSIGSFPR